MADIKYSLEDLKNAFNAGHKQTTKKDYMAENEFGIPEYQVFDYDDFDAYITLTPKPQ